MLRLLVVHQPTASIRFVRIVHLAHPLAQPTGTSIVLDSTVDATAKYQSDWPILEDPTGSPDSIVNICQVLDNLQSDSLHGPDYEEICFAEHAIQSHVSAVVYMISLAVRTTARSFPVIDKRSHYRIPLTPYSLTMSAEPASVTAQLSYFVPPADGSKPWQNINADPVTGIRATNFGREWHPAQIENLRGREGEVSLDVNGFHYFRHPSKHTTFGSAEEIENEYYPESIDLIKQLTGASRVVIFDHTIRRRRPEETADTPDKRQPVQGVHVDQTTASAIARVHRHLPASDAPSLLTKRFQIINLWRPIHHAAFDCPLALCDYSTVDPKRDLVPTTLRYPDRDGETFGVKFSEEHRWKYVRGMTPEEGVLIKCFDSVQDGSVAVLTPHTAFEDPSTPTDAIKRESIELRALVFYD